MPKKPNLWIWIVGAAVIVIAVLAILYGNGRLNMGALSNAPKKIARVALETCPADSNKEGDFCVFTLEPLEYYVTKDGNNFVIYGPKVTDLFSANGWTPEEGSSLKGSAYSVAKSSVTPMTFTFSHIQKNGQPVPSFTFDYQTAKNIQESRFVEVELPGSIKLRFNTFNIPDKQLKNT